MANPKTRLRKKADKLWKQIILDRHNSTCELCGGNWHITAHHYYYRSSAIHLKYDLDNGICLCAKCHARLHFRDPKLVEELIVNKRGIKWLNRLKKKKDQRLKSSYLTIKYYQDIINKLK